jgi:hypothetical protein
VTFLVSENKNTHEGAQFLTTEGSQSGVMAELKGLLENCNAFRKSDCEYLENTIFSRYNQCRYLTGRFCTSGTSV